VVVHVVPAAVPADAASCATVAGPAVVALDLGPSAVSAEPARRIACDASVVVMHHGADGTLLDVGRKRRTIPTALRRALAARDRQCRFPGCTARRCDAHHLSHWADGGPTSLANTLLLCRVHHRAIHDGGFRVERAPDGAVCFFRPDGAPLADTPPATPVVDDTALLGPSAADGTVGLGAGAPVATSELLDLVWALDVLRGRGVGAAPRFQ
jgi:hypothetical protein